MVSKQEKPSNLMYCDLTGELQAINYALCDLEDRDIMDELGHTLINFPDKEMDRILLSFFKNAKLSNEQRIKVIAYYMLAHGRNFWEI